MRFVMCYKNADGWKPVKDDNNNFIIEKVLNNSKNRIKNSKFKMQFKNNW